MAVSDREFAELHADVKHLVDEFDEFRTEVRERMNAGQMKFQQQAVAEAEIRGMRWVAMIIGSGALTAAGVIGGYLITWVPSLFEWLKHR